MLRRDQPEGGERPRHPRRRVGVGARRRPARSSRCRRWSPSASARARCCMPFHFSGRWQGEDLLAVLPGGRGADRARRGGQHRDDLRLRQRDDDAGNQDDALPDRASHGVGRTTMARMKFICDAERCIECNGCVTACKHEHDIPWGVNRRRVVTLNDGVPGERSISVACMHCSDAPCMAVCPVDCFYRTDEGVVLHDKDLCIGCGYCFYACPFGAPQFPQTGAFGAARQDGQVHVLRRRPRGQRLARPSSRSTAATAWPKASCRPAPRCARPRRCSAATATWSPTSSATACSSAARAAKSGAGAPPTASRRSRQRPASRAAGRRSHEGAPRWLLALVACSRSPACGEKPQTIGDATQGRRARPGRAATSPFVAPGWKPGDQASWEQQLRDRAQAPERLRDAQVSLGPPATRSRIAARRRVALALALLGARAAGAGAQDAVPPRRAAPAAPRASRRRTPATSSRQVKRRRELRRPSRATTATPQRNKIQPGNNAPFWRGVRESGRRRARSTTCQVGRDGRADPAGQQYPGIALHHRRRGLAAGAQLLDHSLSAASSALRRRWRSRSTTCARARSAATGADTGRVDRALHALRARRALDERDRVRASSRSPGVVMAFGKFFLLPLIGGTLFGWLTYAAEDPAQLRRPAVRGLAGRSCSSPSCATTCRRAATCAGCAAAAACSAASEPPSDRFNAGEKIVFWGGVLVLGVVVVASGLRARQDRSRARSDAAADAGRAHGPRRRRRVHHRDVHRPHLHGHDRHARRLAAMRPATSTRAGPRSTTRSGTTTSRRQDPGAAHRPPPAPASARPAAADLIRGEARCDRSLRRRCSPSRSPPAPRSPSCRRRPTRPRPRPPRPRPRRVERQGRRLPALQVAGPGRRRPTARARRRGAGQCGVGAGSDAARCADPGPVRRPRRSRRPRPSRSRRRARTRRPARRRARRATTRAARSAEEVSSGRRAELAAAYTRPSVARLTAARAPLTREIDVRDEFGAARTISIPAERAADGLRRQARARHADDARRARPSCWCSATCATSAWSIAATTSSRSPSTGTSTPPR